MRKALIFSIMLSILVCLGAWQVLRLQYKNKVIETIKNGSESIDIYSSSQLKHSKFKNITLEGFFVPKKIFYYRLLDNKPGYEVILPFILEDNKIVLVSLGWSESKTDMPIITTKQEVAGLLVDLYRGNFINPNNNLQKNEWFSLNKKDIAVYTGFDIEPYLVILKKPEYLRSGMKVPFSIDNIPNKHLEYAITWFSLALILTIIFIIDWRKRQ